MHKLIYILLLISSVANAMQQAIEIRMLKSEETIPKLVNLQKSMVMSETPKQLSNHPQAICFKTNIDEFLIDKNSNFKPIYGCIFSDQVAMNASLLRAGLYVHTEMGMANDEKLFNSNMMSTVGGHDFNGKELCNYSKHAIIPKQTLPQHKIFKEIEREFDLQVIKPIIMQNKDNFIFFAIINTKKYKENLSHELLHAQYYNLPEIKPILLQVWNKVPPKDQTIIINALRNGGYDMNQQELLLREFYSYFLQYNAKNYLSSIKVLAPMAELAEIYAPIIQKTLARSNIKVLVLN